MSNSDTHYLSRTSIADQLNISLKELTELMMAAGWITQEGKEWQLTAKGEFEGGLYRDSQKYGRYIVWPSSVLEHPMIVEKQHTKVGVSVLAKSTLLPPRLLNRLLAELGWIRPFAKGWQLTDLGQLFQGEQCYSDDNGHAYVVWPRELHEQDALIEALSYFDENKDQQGSYSTLDGHTMPSHQLRLIANWLYLFNVSYAYKRQLSLPYNEIVCPDFYIPQYGVYINYWAEKVTPSQLAERLAQSECYEQHNMKVIELTSADLQALDQELPRQLQKWGIVTY